MITNSSIKRFFLVFFLLLFAAQGIAGTCNDRFLFTDKLIEKGPYGSGVTTIPLVDTTRTTMPNGDCPGSPVRTLVTEVWYPAMDSSLDGERDAVVAESERGFPLIVHAHGLTSTRFELAYVARHLASHGYVVAAPDFPLSNQDTPCGGSSIDVDNQAIDVIFISKALTSPEITAIFPLASVIDADRIALSGTSLGGMTVILAGNYPDIDAVAMLAPAACNLFALDVLPAGALVKPTVILFGTNDGVLPYDLNATPLYEVNADPKYLVSIENGSHVGFGNTAPLLEQAYPNIPLDYLICGALPIPEDDPCEGCVNAATTGPQLPSLRQHDLTKASLLAFFDGYLRCKILDRFYLKYILERENDDVDVTSSGRILTR